MTGKAYVGDKLVAEAELLATMVDRERAGRKSREAPAAL
jgi:hypothetical protein